MHTLVVLARVSGQPLTGPGGLMEWDPRSIATLADMIDEQVAAERRAARKG